MGAVENLDEIDAGRNGCLQTRDGGFDRVHRLDDVGTGLFEDDELNAAMLVLPGGKLHVFRRIECHANVGDADRRAIAIGDHRILIWSRLGHLVVVVDRISLGVAIHRAFGRVDGGVGEHVAHVFQRQPHRGEPGRVDLHAHRGLLLATDQHLRHAGDL